MASNTFYATSTTNSSQNGLLNGGEDSWGRSVTTSDKTIDLGYFTYNMSSIRSTIPKVATISKVTYSIQFKQSRSSTSLYKSNFDCQLFIDSTAKSANNNTGNVGNSYSTKSYTNSSTITSAELHSKNLRVHYIAHYKGTLTVDQYAKDLKCIIDWSPINTTSISLNKSSMSLNKGGSETLTVTRSPSSVSYPTITWTSSNTGVATVDSNGKVTAVGNGSATITAKTTDGTNLSKTCTVTVTTPVTGVTVSPTTLTLNVGGTYTLSKTISPSDASNKNVTWSTNNTGVATVDSSGKVTAVAKGTCTITCTSSADSTKKGTCAVTVNQQATGISISPTSVTLEVGQTTSVSASVSPSNANNRNYTLSSNNTAVATVSNGVITAIAPGTATITATSSDGGHKANCTVTVKSANIFKIANGSIFIQNMILGSTNIKSAYIGSTQIFKK
jgi:uncharacterized protein YjdB